MMRLADVDATLDAGRMLAGVLRPGDVITVAGGLGSGKTTLARGILAGLGFAGDVPSPSFPILIPYLPPLVRLPFAHVDLYRIDDPAELAELGLDDWTGDGAMLIEWPERAPGRFRGALRLAIDLTGEAARRLTADIPPAWEARWPFR